MLVLVEVAGSQLFFYNKCMDTKTRPQIFFHTVNRNWVFGIV